MTTYVTVNLFEVLWNDDVSPRLSEVLAEYSRLPIDQRWRGDIRLENIDRFQADESVNSEHYVLNFVKQRGIGPGKVASTVPVSDIELDDGEQFGEETAALYLPSQRWLLILNNKHGIGPSRMAEYFNAVDPGNMNRHFDYTVAPCIDRNVLERMKKMRNLTAVEVVASVGAFEHSSVDIGESVEQAAAAASAVRVSVKLEANEAYRKGNFLDFAPTNAFIQSLLGRSDKLQKLDVKGAENADTKDDVIHLIEHKIRTRRNASELSVVHHRYTHTSKIDLLKRVCRGWITELT